ncbi:WPP domain-interacting tail-anchored protein 1-like [Humulus lupulus]|uniref:WPP domain-interacting tail-anchored protein 1-like n=1 Tax=Humulus lupulus TaxID=3486 RepID=UPI002B4086FD|nr:WPP domain-interacting tail-anchored protein 1-like [Humulus lupulus]
MQSAEQQRHILRMLEKSLAREMDLEKKKTELRQVEEVLNQRLVSLEQEVYCMGDETENVWERLFEVDNMAVVSVGISKELLGQLQTLQLNLKTFTLGEKVRLLDKELKESEFLLLNAKYSADVSNMEINEELGLLKSGAGASDKVDSLERQLREFDLQLQCAITYAKASQENQNLLYSTIAEQ